MTESETETSKIASWLLHEVDVGDGLTVETEYGMRINQKVTDVERERTLHLGEFFLGEPDGFHLSIYVDRRNIYGKWFVGGQVLEDNGMYKHKGNIEKADEYMDDYDRGVKNSIFDY